MSNEMEGSPVHLKASFMFLDPKDEEYNTDFIRMAKILEVAYKQGYADSVRKFQDKAFEELSNTESWIDLLDRVNDK